MEQIKISKTMKKNKKRYIYCAGPITSSGTYIKNIRNGIDIGNSIMRLGYFPFIPHVNELWNLVHPMTWEENLEYDEAWLLKCDALYRIPGVSKGADREVSFAKKHGIVVVYSLKELIKKVPRH